MGLFGKRKKEREKEYMNRLDVPLCLKEDFELIIDDVFTIMGVGTVATGNISTGMCREGENACVYKTNGGVLETRLPLKLVASSISFFSSSIIVFSGAVSESFLWDSRISLIIAWRSSEIIWLKYSSLFM